MTDRTKVEFGASAKKEESAAHLTVEDLKKNLRNISSSKRARVLQRFFKTGPGQYGEGDIFVGVTVPESRKLAKKYRHLKLKDISHYSIPTSMKRGSFRS